MICILFYQLVVNKKTFSACALCDISEIISSGPYTSPQIAGDSDDV